MSAFHLAVLGLDNSHPFIDAHNIAQLRPGLRLTAARVEPGERLSRLRSEWAGRLTFRAGLSELLAERPDAILVTLRPSRLLPLLGDLAAAGTPVFVNRPAIVSAAQWARLPHEALRAENLMSSSVLRFAPGVAELAAWSKDRRIRRVGVTVGHGIGHWAEPGNQWQSDPADGGGIPGALIYHAVELATTMLGQNPGRAPLDIERAPVRWEADDRRRSRVHLGLSDGVEAELLLQVTPSEGYSVVVETGSETRRIDLDGSGADPFGYAGAMAAFLRFVESGAAERRWADTLRAIELAVRVFDTARDLGLTEPDSTEVA